MIVRVATEGQYRLDDGESAKLNELDNEIVSLAQDADLWTDVDAFEEAVTRAAGSSDARLYRVALELYAGDLRPDDVYQDWTVERMLTATRTDNENARHANYLRSRRITPLAGGRSSGRARARRRPCRRAHSRTPR